LIRCWSFFVFFWDRDCAHNGKKEIKDGSKSKRGDRAVCVFCARGRNTDIINIKNWANDGDEESKNTKWKGPGQRALLSRLLLCFDAGTGRAGESF